jgi:hypothetical protein
MANYTSTHTGATIDASVTIVSSSGVTQSDLTKLNAVTSSAIELNILDGVTASTAEINILDGLTATTAELNYLDGADSSITTLSLPDNTTITTFGASLIDDADAATARTTLGVDVAGTDNSTDVTLVTTSHDYLSISGQAITLGSIDISDDTNLVGGTGITLTGDTLSTTDSEIVHDNLSGFVANEHIDHSTVSISAGTGLSGGGDLTSTRTLSIDSSVVTLSGIQTLANKSISGTANTISNVHIVDDTINTLTIARGGTGGTTSAEARSNLNVDVAGTDNSTDVTLVTTSHDYLSLTGQAITLGQIDISDDTNLVGGTGITLTGDTLSTTDSEIVHDNLSGFVANEHIDHSGVSITAGAGLTGGGDITATRDIAVGAGTGVTVNADDIAIGQDVGTTQDVTFNSVTADIIGDIRGATKFQAKADVALNKGDAVYISGVSGTTPTVDIADANDSAKMPSFGLAASSVSINASVEIITFGTLAGLNTSAFSVGDIIYISTNGTSGNTLTSTAPSGESSLIQNIGIVQRSHASAGSIKVGGAGRTNATPNLDDGDIFIGNGSNQAVTASLNTKIEDYLDGGTSTANFDIISVDGAEITATPAELNVLDGITSTTAELNYTDGVTSNIQTQLDAKAPLASPAFTGTATGANLTLSGDLTVNGSTTTLDTTNLAVEDNLMELNAGVTSNANDSGFLIERGTTGDNAIFMWDESADKFTLGTTTATGTTTGDITLSSTGTLVANVEGDVTGAVTGNADTATTLATARNFSLTGDVTAGAVSFDGSGNVALSTTIAANSVALGTDTTGNYMSDLTEGTGIDITHTPAEGSNATITLDLTEVGFGGGANRLITDDGDGTVSTEANLTFDGSTLTINNPTAGVAALDFEDTSDLAIFVPAAQTSNYYQPLIGVGENSTTFTAAISSYDAGGSAAQGLAFHTGDTNEITERFRINSSGDVDIKATKKLYLDGGTHTYISETSADNLKFYVGGVNLLSMIEGGTNVIKAGDGTYLGVGDSTDFYMHHSTNSFMTNGTGRLEIRNQAQDQDIRFSVNDGGSTSNILTLNAASSRVGIGTTAPTDTLQVEGSIGVGVGRDAQLTSVNNGLAIRNLVSNADMYFYVNDGGVDTEAMRIDGATANVGIGTNSPTYELDVEGDIGMNAVLYHNGDDNTYLKFDTDRVRMSAGGETLLDLYEDGTQDYVKLGDGGDVDINLNDDMFVRGSDGNVGIGTTSPRLPLHVASPDGDDDPASGSATGAFFVTNSAGSYGIEMGVSSSGDAWIQSHSVTSSNEYNLNLNPIGGNVGIGTTSPSHEMVLRKDQAAETEFSIVNLTSNASAATNLRFRNATSASETGNGVLLQLENGNDFKIFNQFGNNLKLGTNNTERMRIDSSGNVGIGSSSPLEKLHIFESGLSAYKTYTSAGAGVLITSYQSQGNPYTKTTDIVANSDGTVPSEMRLFTKASGASSASERMRIDSSGNVGIGTNSPDQLLDLEADPPVLQLTNSRNGSWTSGDEIAQINFHSNDASGIGAHSVGFIKMITGTGSTTLGGEMTFGTGDYNTAATERMRIDEDGNLKLFDNTANPSASTNNAFIFCDSGEMKVLDELGNTTTISPHNFDLIPGGASEDRAWGYYSEKDIVDDEGNVTATQKVNVDMMKLARLVEQLTGEKLVYTEED